MSHATSAAAPLTPEARNSPPSAQVSLQTGWLLTLSSTPVYEAMNRPSTAPTTLNARLRRRGTKGAPRRWLIHASTKEMKAKNPKTRSAQTPTDIGDQYLKFRLGSPGVTLTSMCQNLIQLTPRSAVKSNGHSNVAGPPMRNAPRAAASSRASPERRSSVPITYEPPAMPAKKK